MSAGPTPAPLHERARTLGRPLLDLVQTDATRHSAMALLALVDYELEHLGDFTDRTPPDYRNLSARLAFLRTELVALILAERLP